MQAWWLGLALGWMLGGTQLDLDCAEPARARALIGRLQLSEIEGAEDINRAAMWNAFGRCPTGPRQAACREAEQRRFEGDWQKQKAAIEAKYRTMLEQFEERCRASIT